jgi:predicted TIM-barrel fold metal-dependent hydrolase
VRRLFEDAAITTVLIDTGYERGEALSEDELAAAGGVTVRRVCRIESLAESLIAGTTRFDDFADRLWAALARLRGDGYVAVKSIIAYRDGLAVDGPPPVHEAEADWAALRRASSSREEGRRVRLDRPALLRYVLFLALEACRAQRLAIQFHAGLGDSDLDLTRANPACLRALLEDERYRDVPIVLLHNYPYLREASYLAHLYRNVYVDASLAIPLVGRAARTILEELFELAPTSKILYASDGHTVPDLFWLGAHYATRAIRAMAETWVAEGVCSAGDAERIAADFLGGNARAVYGL